MADINATGNALTGTTGTGNFVGANTPTLITPIIGAATGTSLNLGSSTTMTGMIDDDTFATASSSTAASSESIEAFVNAQIAAAGQVVQYVVATDATDDTSTSTTLANSSLTASITPTSATNRILVITNAYVSFTTGSSAQNYAVKTAIYRSTGTPAILTGTYLDGHIFNSARASDTAVDTNALLATEISGGTGLTTYYLQFARLAGSGTATCYGSSAGPKIMIVLELLV